jgi:hypothetical protein
MKLDDLSRALKSADLGNASDISAVPFDAKFEILVRVEPHRIDGELHHDDHPLKRMAKAQSLR